MKKISFLVLGMFLFLGFSAQAAEKPDADNLARQGNNFYNQNLLEDAAQKYKEALRINPRHYEAQYNLALAYSDMNKLSEAIDAYKKAIRLNSGDSDAHYNLANCYARKGSYKEAVSEYKIALQLNPKDEDIKTNLEAAQKSLGTPKVVSAPSNVQPKSSFSSKQNFSPRRTEAIKTDSKRAATPSPKTASFTSTSKASKASIQPKQNFSPRRTEAIKTDSKPVAIQTSKVISAPSPKTTSFTETSKTQKTSMQPKQNFSPKKNIKPISQAPVASKKVLAEPKPLTSSKKAEYYSKALQVDAYKTETPKKEQPKAEATNIKKLKDEVLVYKREASPKPALNAFESPMESTASIELAKLNEAAQKKKIELQKEAEIRQKEAEARQKEALEMEKAQKDLMLKADELYNQGNTNLRSSRFKDAVMFYNQSLAIRANDKDTHYNLGVAYDRLNKPVEAEKEYRETLRLDPNFLMAQYNLAVLLYRQGKQELSRPYFESYIQKAPREHSRQINAAKQALASMTTKQTSSL